MTVPDASIVAAAKSRGIIVGTAVTNAPATQKAAAVEPSLPSLDGQKQLPSDDRRLDASAHWLPMVPSGQPKQLPSMPVGQPHEMTVEDCEDAPETSPVLALPEPHDDGIYELPSACDTSTPAVTLPDADEVEKPSAQYVGSIRSEATPAAVHHDLLAVEGRHSSSGGEAPSTKVNLRKAKTRGTRIAEVVRRSTIYKFFDGLQVSECEAEERLRRGKFVDEIFGRSSVREMIYKEGLLGRLTKSKYFETLTLAVISLNAVWIGVDLELNEADTWLDASPVFQVADNAFCVFFTFEVVIRFWALRRKLNCFDPSFLFDIVLVVLMVFETWILTVWLAVHGGKAQNLRQLSILRLLRLLRLTRMGRLMKMVPELMTLMKGLLRAIRSVATTLLFLVASLWIFGIVFAQVYREEDDSDLFQYFSRLGTSMVTLFINGTLLDECNAVAGLLRDDNLLLMVVFFFFVLLSSMTLLNMLIGVLTSVIADTAIAEKERLSVAEATRQLQDVFNIADVNGDQKISKDEFEKILADEDNSVTKALLALGINGDRLRELSRQLFEDEDADPDHKYSRNHPAALRKSTSVSSFAHTNWVPKDLSFPQFIDELILLKPGSSVSVRDVMGLRRHSTRVLRSFEKALSKVREELAHLQPENLPKQLSCRGNSSPIAGLSQLPSASARLASSRLDDWALPATTAESEEVGTFAKAIQIAPQNKLSSVPTEMLFEELHWRLRSRKQTLDDTCSNVVAME